jgi:NAD(P) transhydrogenase subunit alpha
MQRGSVLVDLAVDSGGNIAGSQPDEEVEVNGARIVGLANLPGRVAVHASQMFSSNLFNLVNELWDTEKKTIEFDFDDEIVRGCVVTHDGEIVNEVIRNHYQQS